ncbi:helix-turn-helix domain-containing protein [Enterococcus sp. DIV0242_7C1]|uniref:Mga helix-turn-helix domain-containing protein n=1 Tax=Candidatus Enterococcus dunnyi TaxID=1834192 RepID=A0A200JDK7_9ENTE|nr:MULTISPECIES: helix-turn-helix domain-containing protein [unclassified Enterococcus]MBO0469408.1 helix-turn-helix domain-containing protein [Enterococcus sp. DIV0242_7C1]OUZ35296.1 hypothetical protein A5889_000772 [Enterococcus sp. 9D6_DIV0238]
MDYKELIDYDARKLLDLFLLLASADGKEKLEIFSRKLSINAKTILRYIKKIKLLIKRFQLEAELSISRKSINYYYLKKSSDYYVEIFLTRFLCELPEIIFLKAIIDDTTIQTKEFSERLSISESSLRRRIKKIDLWLSKSGLSLRRGSYQLVGDEVQIRAFILHFYWLVYRGTIGSFLSSEIESSDKLTETIIHFFQIKINDLQKLSFSRMIQIALWRENNGHQIRQKSEWSPYLKESAIFSNFVQTIVKEDFAKKIPLSEFAYLYLMIQANFLPYYGASMQAFIIEEHFLKKTTCYLNTLIATTRFRQIFWEKRIEHSKASVISFLSFHLLYELVSDLSFDRNRSVNKLQEMYPKFLKRIHTCVDELIVEIPIYKKVKRELLVHRYFTILSTLTSPVYNEKKIVICLMTDFSIEKEYELGKRITAFFQYKYNLVVIYARTSSTIGYATLILTTTYHQNLFHQCERPVMLIDIEFCEKQFFQLEKYLKKVIS